MTEEAHVGEATHWISSTFKVLEGLLGLRRPPQSDRSAARPSQVPTSQASQVPAPEAIEVSPPDAILSPKPEAEADALPPQNEAGIETAPTQAFKTLPVQEDDESRRKLIRQLFNDYWTGLDDKPPTFAKRLEMAEGYINDRLADREVGWRLDAVTRKQLGLPSSSIDS
jgi:hypothetical protein